MIPTAEHRAFAEFADMLADLARPIAQQYFGQPIPVDHKADHSPVTLADREIEMALVAAIRRRFPDHGIFGEETGQHNMQADYIWVIDPIDGTKAFIGGKTTFTTLIALCHEGEPIVGVIDQPIRKERWIGSDVTRFNGKIVEVEPCESMADALIATTSTGYFSADQARGFHALEHASHATLLNHDGYAYGMLAKGSMDIVIDVKLKPYDFCALVPIVEGAGGIITDWSDVPLSMHSAGHVIACSNILLHKQALDLLHHAGK